jgi:hypothetical protein
MKKKLGFSRICVMYCSGLVLACAAASPALAATNTVITYEVVPTDTAAQFEYRYTFTNLSSAQPLQLVSIDFGTSEFGAASFYDEASLQAGSVSPGDWTQRVLPPVLDEHAQYEAYSATGAGAGTGNSLSGFSVQFTWLGGNKIPGDQTFTVYDPNTFAVLETGSTHLISAVPAVPEPSTLIMMGFGLFGLLNWQRQKSWK